MIPAEIVKKKDNRDEVASGCWLLRTAHCGHCLGDAGAGFLKWRTKSGICPLKGFVAPPHVSLFVRWYCSDWLCEIEAGWRGTCNHDGRDASESRSSDGTP